MTFRHLIVTSAALVLIGCAAPPMPVSSGHLESGPANPAGAIPVPVQVPIVPPRPQPAVKAETYSVVVNSVRVHELLFALARDARLNIDIHPGITGAVTLNAIDQTLPQLLSRISKQVDMRYEIDGPNLLVMPDTPFLRVYKINYVNMVRETSGDVSVSAEIAGGSAGGAGGGGAASSGGGAANVSTVKIKNVSNNRFWPTLVDNVKDILRETDKILPTGGTAAVAPVALAAAAGRPAAAGARPVALAAPNVTFREAASVISNPESGVLFIRASSRQHEKIQEFLDRVLTNARRQVLIEATIVEVRLSSNYQQGIDWSYLGRNINITQAAAALTGPVFALSRVGSVFNVTLKLLETFGTTRIISSPRISALNNQTAVLKVVENVVYFIIKNEISQGSVNQGNLQSTQATPYTVPVGLVMNITPQISDDDTILLNVKPSISSVTKNVPDPSDTTGQNTIPQIASREMESVLKLSSGQIGVMGGLIQDRVQNTDNTIPGLNRLPLLGNLFANRSLVNEKTELVIFLRPIVVHDPSLQGDYSGYRVFLPGENFLSAPNPGRPLLPDTQVQ